MLLPPLLVAVTVNMVRFMSTDGVPEIVPVFVENDNPAGNAGAML